jgi:hypothetical protein
MFSEKEQKEFQELHKNESGLFYDTLNVKNGAF